jgi:hypothetical protein
MISSPISPDIKHLRSLNNIYIYMIQPAHWNASQVTTFDYMFHNATSFNQDAIQL